MSYPKQPNKPNKKAKPQPTIDPEMERYSAERLAQDAAFYGDEYRLKLHNSTCIEEALDGLASVISTYVTQARDGENGWPVYGAPNGYPVRLVLEGAAVDKIADAQSHCRHSR